MGSLQVLHSDVPHTNFGKVAMSAVTGREIGLGKIKKRASTAGFKGLKKIRQNV